MWYLFSLGLFTLTYYKLFYLLFKFLYEKYYIKNTEQSIIYYTKLYDWVQGYIALIKW